MVAKLLAVQKSDECGCPEEEWDIHSVFTTIHLEPDGGGHIFLDCGDWDAERLVECAGIEDLRAKAIAWVESLPTEQQLGETT